MDDTYTTLAAPSSAVYTEKRSKFLAFALPVTSEAEVKEALARYQREYYDARHVCYAYMLGPERTLFRSNDNGEPVRYFGGIKLGTGGLTVAYKTAAREALEAAEHVERTVDDTLVVTVPYTGLNEVMRVVKDMAPAVLEQGYSGMDCRMVLRLRRSLVAGLRARLEKIDFLRVEEV